MYLINLVNEIIKIASGTEEKCKVEISFCEGKDTHSVTFIHFNKQYKHNNSFLTFYGTDVYGSETAAEAINRKYINKIKKILNGEVLLNE